MTLSQLLLLHVLPEGSVLQLIRHGICVKCCVHELSYFALDGSGMLMFPSNVGKCLVLN